MPLWACNIYSVCPIVRIAATNDQDFQSQYLAVIATGDMMKRCTTRHPSHFQFMLANQLEMQQVKKLFRYVLSTFRLVPSRIHSDRKQCVAVPQTLLKGVKVGPYYLCLLNGDNIGHVIKGYKASYAQQTIFQDIIVQQPCLAGLKIHCEQVG